MIFQKYKIFHCRSGAADRNRASGNYSKYFILLGTFRKRSASPIAVATFNNIVAYYVPGGGTDTGTPVTNMDIGTNYYVFVNFLINLIKSLHNLAVWCII